MPIAEKLKTWEGMDIEAIEYAFNKVSPLIATEYPDAKTRTKLKKLMEAFLPDYEIKCDEENNSPEVVESQHIMVRVNKYMQHSGVVKYIDVIF